MTGRALWPARSVFLVYALLIFVLSHWPRLRLEGAPVHRPDLYLHFGVFFLWVLLFALAAWFGGVLDRRNIWWSAIVAGVYSSLEEASQAIPVFQRTAAWSDLGANLAGVGAGTALLLILRMRAGRADTDEHREP